MIGIKPHRCKVCVWGSPDGWFNGSITGWKWWIILDKEYECRHPTELEVMADIQLVLESWS
jgi:hypothetical protein